MNSFMNTLSVLVPQDWFCMCRHPETSANKTSQVGKLTQEKSFSECTWHLKCPWVVKDNASGPLSRTIFIHGNVDAFYQQLAGEILQYYPTSNRRTELKSTTLLMF